MQIASSQSSSVGKNPVLPTSTSANASRRKRVIMIAKTVNPRAAYAGELLLTSERTESMDSWQPAQQQRPRAGLLRRGQDAQLPQTEPAAVSRSYVVLDSKGRLFHEMAPYLSNHGYTVDCLDFTTMEGTIGYDPLHHVRWRRVVRLRRTSLALRVRSFPATRWVTTRFGRVRLPITLQATSPTFLRHCPIANGTWHRS